MKKLICTVVDRFTIDGVEESVIQEVLELCPPGTQKNQLILEEYMPNTYSWLTRVFVDIEGYSSLVDRGPKYGSGAY